ncbi:hypothetical protein QVD17_31896 [Tagetes erecta]|uniref:Uncharacterized protein n=1 Tax=Tagetes erecta TaxID=13708 RepID=A0AAD8K6H8_TARER|nr:hypothetical protein QVD17_31896 [Tagetes erecta]
MFITIILSFDYFIHLVLLKISYCSVVIEVTGYKTTATPCCCSRNCVTLRDSFRVVNFEDIAGVTSL